MTWTPVTESLPPHGTRVWMCKWIGDIPLVIDGYYTSNQWWNSHDIEIFGVTDWQLLVVPDPPTRVIAL